MTVLLSLEFVVILSSEKKHLTEEDCSKSTVQSAKMMYIIGSFISDPYRSSRD